MILTAEPIAAAEACRIGLVNDVVAHEDLRATAFELAYDRRQIAVGGAACLGSVTRGLNRDRQGPRHRGGRFARMARTRDIEEEFPHG